MGASAMASCLVPQPWTGVVRDRIGLNPFHAATTQEIAHVVSRVDGSWRHMRAIL